MKNISVNNCKENKTRISYSINFFPKIVRFVRWCGRIWYSQTGYSWQ